MRRREEPPLQNPNAGASRNARQVSRFLNELIEANPGVRIEDGLALVRPQARQLRNGGSAGRLRFQVRPVDISQKFGTVMPDNQILGAILALREENPGVPVVLVSKDINLRIKASICGVPAEDYENDRALDFSLLYTGSAELAADFWDRHEADLRSWTDKGRTFYELRCGEDEAWEPNQFLHLPGAEEVELRVVKANGERPVLQIVDDYRHQQHAVWACWRATASRTSPSTR